MLHGHRLNSRYVTPGQPLREEPALPHASFFLSRAPWDGRDRKVWSPRPQRRVVLLNTSLCTGRAGPPPLLQSSAWLLSWNCGEVMTFTFCSSHFPHRCDQVSDKKQLEGESTDSGSQSLTVGKVAAHGSGSLSSTDQSLRLDLRWCVTPSHTPTTTPPKHGVLSPFFTGEPDSPGQTRHFTH